jgi:hypothetical protein
VALHVMLAALDRLEIQVFYMSACMVARFADALKLINTSTKTFLVAARQTASGKSHCGQDIYSIGLHNGDQVLYIFGAASDAY